MSESDPAETGSDPEPGVEPEAQPQVEPEAQPQVEPEVGLDGAEPEVEPETESEGSKPEAEPEVEQAAEKPEPRERSSTDARLRKRKRTKPATAEGSDPPLFPRGKMLFPWLLLVFVMPIFVGIAGPIYADSLRREERAKRRALEEKMRSKWKTDEQAKRNARQAYDRGRKHRENDEHTEAIEAFTIYLDQNPGHVDAHWMRGLSRLELQDLVGAREDFDSVISKRPSHAAAHRSRGQVRALLGDRVGGLEDFQSALELRPDAYPAIWIAGLGGDVDEVRPFASGRTWIGCVARYYIDRMTEEQLLARAGQATTEDVRLEQLCEAHGYIGLRAERDGDKPKAMQHYRKCVDTRVTNFIEYRWALVRLNQEAQGNSTGPFDLEKD